MRLDSNTSSELLFMINQLPLSLKKQIPIEIQKELLNEYNKEIYNSFIPDKPFYKQKMSDEALSVLYNLILQYITNENYN